MIFLDNLKVVTVCSTGFGWAKCWMDEVVVVCGNGIRFWQYNGAVALACVEWGAFGVLLILFALKF